MSRIFGRLATYRVQRRCTNAKRRSSCAKAIKTYVRKQGAYPPKKGRRVAALRRRRTRRRGRARRRLARESIPRGEEFQLAAPGNGSGGFIV